MHSASPIAISLFVALGASGCSLLFAPSDAPILLADAGVDSTVDSSMDATDSMPDTGPDTGMDGGVDTGPGSEVDCADGVDNDMDGLTDCADFDCTGNPRCCEAGDPQLSENWVAMELTGAWAATPSDDANFPSRGGTMDGERYIDAFEPPGIPRGIVARQCVPVAVGLELTIELEARGDTSCAEESRCERRAGVALSPANDTLPGNWLTDDLGLMLHANGHFEITRNGDAIEARDFEPRQRVRLFLTISPGVGSGGQAAMFASVAFEIVGGGMPEPEPILVGREFLDLARLIDDPGGCERIPGLYIGVQGQGDGVWVRDLSASTRQCVNPSQFQSPLDGDVALRYDDLGFSTFAEGGMSAPTLTSSRDAVGGPVRWDLLVSGTNDDPNLDKIVRVGWAVGHARSNNWDMLPWDSSVTPKAGDDVPSCNRGMVPCDGLVSVREPSLLAELSDSGLLDLLSAAFAQELDPGGELFGIYTVPNVAQSPGTPVTIPGAPTIAPAQVPGSVCDSLRDPALLRVEAGFWLFFTCERNGGFDSIHAVKLGGDFSLTMDGVEPIHQVVLDSSIGAYAVSGVSGPEVIIDTPTDGDPVIRLWFLAHGEGRETTVALAQAEVKAAAIGSLLPVFVPFDANPVLRSSNPALGACPDDCPLQGFAVTRRTDDLGVLRFVVARRVNDPVDGLFDELVPLEQFWSTL